MIIKFPQWARLAVVSSTLLTIAFASGCGFGDGSGRNAVSGKVTYQGQPVPSGSIAFEPDASRGGKGPGAVAEIKDGSYHMARDKGPKAGPHRVQIMSYDDGRSLKPENKVFFPPYETTVDLPSESSEQNFDIPAVRH